MMNLIDADTPRNPEPQPKGYAPDAEPVHVVVNHGRWLVRCRNCPGAELARRRHPWFWCTSCYNHHLDNRLIPVIWPADPDAIAALLGPRPLHAKNWEPGESLDVLRAENMEHGI